MEKNSQDVCPLLSVIWNNLNKRDFFVADIGQIVNSRDLLKLALRYAHTVKFSKKFDQCVAVPIIADRTIHTIAAIIGTIISGHAFATISISQPASRIEACVKELNTTAVLCGTHLNENEAGRFLEILSASKNELSNDQIDINAKNDQLLYILFTSGSTGKPKGVMCSHNNILNTLVWSHDYLKWNKNDCVGVASQFSFDISMFDFFISMFKGIPLVILEKPNDPRVVLNQINKHNITSIFSVPFFFSQFLHGNLINQINESSLKRIISGGDFFPPSDLLAWLNTCPQLELYNVWGPTETSIVNTMYKVSADDIALLSSGQNCSVGKTHPRMMFSLIEPDNEEPTVISGNTGEIAMFGESVSLGYLNNPQLNKSKYFNYRGEKAFRTGDLGTLKNNLLFIEARIGRQVKIAGHRIDLAEVEAAVTASSTIFASAAFTVEIVTGVKEIWCCVEANQSKIDIDIFKLKAEVRKKIPLYMVPKRFFALNKLPLNANGKIDRDLAKKLVSKENE